MLKYIEYRKYSQSESNNINVSDEITILTGYNGSGKTTILESIIEHHQNVNHNLFENINVVFNTDIPKIVHNLWCDNFDINSELLENHLIASFMCSRERESDGFTIYDEMKTYLLNCIRYKKYTPLSIYMANRLQHEPHEKYISLIDQIDINLHLVLQDNAISMLQLLFPNDQFIITTHSPCILRNYSDDYIVCLNEE